MPRTRNRRYILLLITLTFASRIALASFTYGAGLIDIQRYEVVGNAILEGRTAYDLDMVYYPYPPPWMYVEAASALIAQFTGLSFDFVIKIPIIISDVAISLVVYAMLKRSQQNETKALLWSLAFALNPVAIMISAGHGQFDSIPIFLTLVSLHVLMDCDRKQHTILASSLLIGLGIAFKLYPVIILPLLLIYQYRTTRSTGDVVRFTAVSMLPLALSLMPFAITGQWNAFIWPVKYPVFADAFDFGLIRVTLLAGINLPFFALITKVLFFVGYALVFATIKFDDNWATDTVTAIFLVFYSLGGSVGAQYYFWILPFAAATKRHGLFPYSIITCFALVCYYAGAHHAAILGTRSISDVIAEYARKGYAYASVILWGFTSIWMLFTIYSRIKTLRSPAPSAHNAKQP